MTKAEAAEALKIARSTEDLSAHEINLFDGYGLWEFQAVHCTVKQVARLIRWQCLYIAKRLGGPDMDADEFNELCHIGRKKFIIVG